MPVLEKLLGQKQTLPKRKIDNLAAFSAAFPQAAEVIIDGNAPFSGLTSTRRNVNTILAKRSDTHEKRLSSWIKRGEC